MWRALGSYENLGQSENTVAKLFSHYINTYLCFHETMGSIKDNFP
jgi:hypothetical protein